MSVAGQSVDPSITQLHPDEVTADQALLHAREQSAEQKLSYAGSLPPQEAWRLFSNGHAVLVDVRTAEERKFVGHVPGSIHVPWQTGLSLTKNPRFVGELGAKVKKNSVLLFLCRSGKRSALAAEAATKGGFAHVFNVQEGFEGDIDEQQQRGKSGGWRSHNLPWVQD